MRRYFYFFACTLLATASCTQKKIEDTSYKAGKVAAEVVEVVEEGYYATVKGSKAAYRRMKDGYHERRASPGERSSSQNSDEPSQQDIPAQDSVVRDGDDRY
jgi:hypothetical protein